MFVTGVAFVPPGTPPEPSSLEAVLRAWLHSLRDAVELREWHSALAAELHAGGHLSSKDSGDGKEVR